VATAWQTLEEAALTLGISSRTLHRRLARGEFETRMESGRREVLVVIPDPPPVFEPQNTPDGVTDESGTLSDASDNYDPAAGDESDGSDDVGHAMLTLHEDRIRRTDLAIMAYQQSVNVTAADARRAHVRTKVAWGVTGGLTVLTFVGAIWATHTVTKAKGEVDHLGKVVRQLTDVADTKSAEVDRLRTQAETARLAAARVEGQLEAARGQIDQLKASVECNASTASAASATTQPASATTQPAVSLNDVIDRITLR
jgi:hypothetical protein